MKPTFAENIADLGNGQFLTCLCGKHKPDSTCEVYLRNNGKFPISWRERFQAIDQSSALSTGEVWAFSANVKMFIEQEIQITKKQVIKDIIALSERPEKGQFGRIVPVLNIELYCKEHNINI